MIESRVLSEIIKGAKSSKTIVVSYRSKGSGLTTREVEPYEIKDNKLFCYCLNKNSVRCFLLDNILDAVCTDNKYSPRFPIKIA